MSGSQHPIDIFDRLEGLYVYCVDYHEGQWSFLYSLIGRLFNAGFRKRSLCLDFYTLTNEGKVYYHQLVTRRYGQ